MNGAHTLAKFFDVHSTCLWNVSEITKKQRRNVQLDCKNSVAIINTNKLKLAKDFTSMVLL